MMKPLRIASIVLCLLILVLPALAIPFLGSGASDDENRYLADYPALADGEEGLNPDFDTDFEAWLCDHFALRKPVIAANALANYRLLHTSVNDRVIAGAGDWLYFADTVPDYTGEGRLSDGELDALVGNLSALGEALSRRGARLYIAIVPNKSTVYPQYMPGRYAMRQDGGNIERLRSACKGLDAAWIDLVGPLKEATQASDVYLHTDTHWNDLGAAIAAREILEALERPSVDFSVEGEATFSDGDLARLMGPTGRLSEGVPNVVPAQPLPQADFSRHALTCEGSGEGDLLVYRDSFGTAIGPWLAQAYGQTRLLWSTPLDATFDCDDALILICERNLREYLGEPPLLEEDDADDVSEEDMESDEEVDDEDDPLAEDWEEIDEDWEEVDDEDNPLDEDWEEVDEDDPLDEDWEEVDEEGGLSDGI